VKLQHGERRWGLSDAELNLRMRDSKRGRRELLAAGFCGLPTPAAGCPAGSAILKGLVARTQGQVARDAGLLILVR